MDPNWKPEKERIKAHLERIARPREIFENPETLSEVQDYIEAELTSCGYSVEKRPFQYQGKTLVNLVATRQPASDQPRFLIGAHFDSVSGTPGADDNASGIAGMLEAARLLAASPAAQGVEWIAFNAEEHGMVGSTEFVRDLKARSIPIRGMISLEMIGYTDQTPGSQEIPAILKPFYPDTGNFVALVSDIYSRTLLKTAKKCFNRVQALNTEGLIVPGKGSWLPAVRLSDHSPFWDAGFPALLVTDTSFFRNPHYHLATDSIQTLDLDFLTNITEATVQLALEMGREKTDSGDLTSP